MNNPELEYMLDRAKKLIEQHCWDEALTVLDKATYLDLKCASVWYQKGKILNRLGRFDEALEAFETLIRINPCDSDAWYNKGVILTKLGRTAESLEAYHEAGRLNPDNSDKSKLDGIDFFNILGRGQTAIESIGKIAGIEDSEAYINEKFMYRIALSFMWADGIEEALSIKEITPSKVEVKSPRYPQCLLTIEASERIRCNYPAKELGRDMAAEIATSESEISFYVFPNGHIPAHRVRTSDETTCDIIVTDRFAYRLKRDISRDDRIWDYFSEYVPVLFRPYQTD